MDKFKELGAAIDQEFEITQSQIEEIRNTRYQLHSDNALRIKDLEEKLERQKQHNKSISNILRELADRLGEEI